jgi:predicted branched-subunit amino acid permease
MGIALKQIGFDLVMAVLFSGLVFSASAQAVAVQMWMLPVPIAAMAVAALGINARYLVMGAYLRELFQDVSPRRMIPTLLLLTDGSWMMAVAEAERGRRDVGYLLGISVALYVGWVAGTALGHALSFGMTGALAVGAAFLPVAMVVGALPSQWKSASNLLSWSVAAVVTLVAAIFIPGHWTMILGAAVGIAVAMAGADDDR